MSITVGDILKVVCTMAYTDGNIIQNVFNAVVTGSGGPFDEDDVVDDLVDWLDDMYSNLSVHIAAAIDPTAGHVYVYDSVDDDWDEIGAKLPTFTTTNVAELLPRGVALLVNARTTDPDVNGKKYLGGLVETGWDSTFWDSGVITSVIAFTVDWYTAFVGSASGATFTPAIWSPTRTAAYPLSGTFIIPTMASYQRRRKPGVGS